MMIGEELADCIQYRLTSDQQRTIATPLDEALNDAPATGVGLEGEWLGSDELQVDAGKDHILRQADGLDAMYRIGPNSRNWQQPSYSPNEYDNFVPYEADDVEPLEIPPRLRTLDALPAIVGVLATCDAATANYVGRRGEVSRAIASRLLAGSESPLRMYGLIEDASQGRPAAFRRTETLERMISGSREWQTEVNMQQLMQAHGLKRAELMSRLAEIGLSSIGSVFIPQRPN